MLGNTGEPARRHLPLCYNNRRCNDMTTENHELPAGDAAQSGPAGTPASLGKVGASRRRLAGLGATGVVMTLASQSAMAAAMCRAPSGAMSGALSHAPVGLSCTGQLPDWWVSNTSAWSGTGVGTNAFFKDFFDATGMPGLTSIRTLEVLSSTLYETLPMYIMAAYLNVASGKNNFITTERLTTIWNEWRTPAGFAPYAGAKVWNTGDIVLYLKSIAG